MQWIEVGVGTAKFFYEKNLFLQLIYGHNDSINFRIYHKSTSPIK